MDVKKLLAVCLLFVSVSLYAASGFVVEKIRVQGLKRISLGTVLNYLPIQEGQRLESSDTTQIIKALYKTGFFSDVNLARKGNVLLINVQERPTIGRITVSGNKIIPTKALLQGLKNVDIAEGHVYDKSVVDHLQDSLQMQYYDRGNYNAQVQTTVTPESQNRVSLNIVISEGPVAKIKQIKIIGNNAFSEKKLRKNFKLTTRNIWSFLTKDDQYSKEKLDGDLERLRSFYLDRGYIQFNVESTQVSITPDKRDVYIIIHINEGDLFTLKGYKFTGQLLYSQDTLRDLVSLGSGDVFSRKKVTQTSSLIGNFYGNDGYTFASVRPIPEVDSENKEVFVTFLIEPGHRVYVRRINFVGNTKTEDQVLRREMRQQEASVASLDNIKLSEHRLNSLGYFKGIAAETKHVPGTDDQIDLNFHVVESPSATLTVGAGYSDTKGFLLNAGFNQPNFLGTGKSLGLNFDHSEYYNSYAISYFNPYYTKEGIGRGITAYAHTSNYDKADVSDYTSDQYGLDVYYSYPLSETDSLTLGYGYQITNIDVGSNPSLELRSFVAKNGDDFYNVKLNAGWNHVNLDRPVFPTRGIAQYTDVSFALPGGGDSNTYYKLNYTAHYYHPLFAGFILSLRGELGYGDGFLGTDELPFFENYYAGGVGVRGGIRGYRGYSIGPKDSKGNTIGGNVLVDGSVDLILPIPISPETLRMSLFVDAANVYSEVNTSVDSGPVRFSAGIATEWRSPIGPLVVSLGFPLNRQATDSRETMQFNIGTSF